MKNFAKLQRFLEILPGLSVWAILATPFFLGVYYPRQLAFFVIVFDFYWLTKSMMMGAYLVSAHLHMKRDGRINWLERVKKIDSLDDFILRETSNLVHANWFNARRAKEDVMELIDLRNKGTEYVKSWKDIYHLVLLPHYKDEYDILHSAVESCVKANYPTEKTIIVIALEAREEGDEKFKKVEKIKKEFKDKFFDIFYTIHEDNPSEMKGKSANIKWAGREIKKYIDKKNIDYENVIVSAFDGDTRVSREYFGCLTYKYLVNIERTKRTYQPVPLFNNNIWEVPFLNRLVVFGASFWQMIESCRPYRLINFSSQAMSLKTLVDIDFWDETIVSEDSRQFYRVFFRYKGNHRAVPLFTPVLMDAVFGNSLWQAFKNQYYQKRRWAWGVENFPYLVIESIKHKEIKFWKKFIHIYRLYKGSVEWSTASLLIAFAGWLPIVLNRPFRDSVLAYNLPIMAQNILVLTWFGIFITTYISFQLLPPRPKKYPKVKILEMIIQWVFVPVTAIFFGSMPALDAQTRMMLGGRFRLGFWKTPKKFERKD